MFHGEERWRIPLVREDRIKTKKGGERKNRS